MIGKASSSCPMIMAPGENNSPRFPKGAFFEIKEYTRSPITTVGRAIRLFMSIMMSFFPLKGERLRKSPRGSAQTVARTVEVNANLREVDAMKSTSLFPFSISSTALINTPPIRYSITSG